ncbi:hypothetical protein EJD97_018149 [Solanum chilense]|uniref:Uncharacterized protein n=1 Tax=Solanum chilense TaxID=4083 RepID=A0A6N2B441_SOLCI|nr:hypothetical protein EJD97_018149 [Solanum chilense]
MLFPSPSPHHIGSYGDRNAIYISKYLQIITRVYAFIYTYHTSLVPDLCLLILKEKCSGPVGLL